MPHAGTVVAGTAVSALVVTGAGVPVGGAGAPGLPARVAAAGSRPDRPGAAVPVGGAADGMRRAVARRPHAPLADQLQPPRRRNRTYRLSDSATMITADATTPAVSPNPGKGTFMP